MWTSSDLILSLLLLMLEFNLAYLGRKAMVFFGGAGGSLFTL